jgi:hypothetical protein
MNLASPALGRGQPSSPRPKQPLPHLNKKEHQALLDAIAGRRPGPNHLRWHLLVETAGRHRVASLVADSLSQVNLPKAAKIRLEELTGKASQRTGLAYQALTAVLGAARQRGLPLLVFKGPALCETLYARPELRSFFDLDLLVQEEDLEQTEQMLVDLGYELRLLRTSSRRWLAGAHDPTPIGEGELLSREETRELYLKHHFHLPYVPKEGTQGLRIDLHWALFPETELQLPMKTFWRRVEPITLAGEPALTFKPEDNLFYLCLHTGLDGYRRIRLLKLLDILRLAEKLTEEEWDRLEERVLKYHADRLFILALQLAYQAFHRPLPERIQSVIAPSFSRRLLLSLLSDGAIIGGDSLLAEAAWDWYLGRPGQQCLYRLLRGAARRLRRKKPKKPLGFPPPT